MTVVVGGAQDFHFGLKGSPTWTPPTTAFQSIPGSGTFFPKTRFLDLLAAGRRALMMVHVNPDLTDRQGIGDHRTVGSATGYKSRRR